MVKFYLFIKTIVINIYKKINLKIIIIIIKIIFINLVTRRG